MAGERVWLLDGGGDPTPLEESPYPDETALQRLIADCPEVLAGEQMTPGEPRRWLPVRREMGIADGAEAGDRWSVEDDPYTHSASSRDGAEAWYVAPEDAATHVDVLAGRVEAVLRELADL